MGNFISKMRLESWMARFLGRPEEKYPWQGRSMARPVVRSDYMNAYSPRLAPHRTWRTRMDPLVLLGIAFGLVLCGIIIISLVLIAQSVFGKPLATAPDPKAIQPAAAALPIAVPGKPVKILLLGSDQRPNDSGFRTDVIMLVQIDPGPQTVSVVSFPRDLWVEIPAHHDAMKINMVQQYGGFEATAQMFQDNFGVKPDYYILTNFGGFTSLIDSQGGVDVQAAQDLTDECSLPQKVDGKCSVKAGMVHMDGATALWYVRSRYSSSDFDRLRRAQEVLYAVFKKMFTIGSLAKLPELKAAMDQYIQTDLTIDKALTFLPVALSVLQSPDKVKRFAIGPDQTTESISWNGMWILLQNPGAIPEVLSEAGMR